MNRQKSAEGIVAPSDRSEGPNTWKGLTLEFRYLQAGMMTGGVVSPREDLNQMLRGWIQYFRLAEVKGIFEELDGWLRRKLRCLLWRQWKRSLTRAKSLMKRGLEKLRAWKSATNGRGAWWNAGASYLNEAFPKSFFDGLGLISLLDQLRKLQSSM